MRPFLVSVAAAFLMLLMSVPPVAQAAEDDPVRTVSVSGHAEEQATPDRARASAGVVTQAPTAAEAVNQNSAAMQKVFDALREAGIEEADIRTSGFNVSPVYDEVKGPRQAPRVVAYRVANTVSVLMRDTARVGATLDALVKAGANELHGVGFFVARDEEMQDRLRVAAIKDARRKAEMMAEAAGASLGEVVTISETGRGGPPVPVMRMQAEAMSVPVSAGTETLSTSVSVTFRLR